MAKRTAPPGNSGTLEQALAASEAMRARAALAAREAREAATLAAEENRALRQELDALQQDAARERQTAAEYAAVLARTAGEQARRLLQEAQRREERLDAQVMQLQAELKHIMAERDRLLGAVSPLHDLELILASGLFDADWYRARYADVTASGMDPALHFFRIGLPERRDPGPQFELAGYLRLNPDVAGAGMHPLLHYLRYGFAEGRERPRVTSPAPAQAAIPAATDGAAAYGGVSLVLVSGEPETPGHTYRVQRFAEAAAMNGARVVVVPMHDTGSHLDSIAAADIVLIWRTPWCNEIASVTAAARAGAARLVFDVDDLMFEPALATPAVIDGIRSQGFSAGQVAAHYQQIRTAMDKADFCLTTTEELATHLRRHAKPTLVIPNGFDLATWQRSRRAVRQRHFGPEDRLLRIGYAGGSRTHQRDFAAVARPLARLLRERSDCRLVLFRDPKSGDPLIDLPEFPDLAALPDRIEWRDMVPLTELPAELARLDVNLAPLEMGNPFCEAKSELKYFEAALVDVPTIASATGPFSRAIAHGRTGLLAADESGWEASLSLLLDDPVARWRMGHAARLDVIWRYGPEYRAQLAGGAIDQIMGGRRAAVAFARLCNHDSLPPLISLPDSETLFLHDSLGQAQVTVVIPLYNYGHFIEEALDSVRLQTLEALDLIVVDDGSTDGGLPLAIDWAQRHRNRFNRIDIRRNLANAGLGPARNAGFAAAETPYVLPLDADNRLRPRCCKRLLDEAVAQGAAFAYPVIRQFGDLSGRLGAFPYAPARLIGLPYIDAMALVSVAAWAGAGGYSAMRQGWEDYEFWCRMAERGMHGVHVPGEPLAEYRVHTTSMLRTITENPAIKPQVVAQMQQRHPWLRLVDAAPTLPLAGDRPPFR